MSATASLSMARIMAHEPSNGVLPRLMGPHRASDGVPMAGLKLDMKLDTQRNLAPIIDVGIVILVALVIVVAAGSNVTLPVVGVVALWAAYYLVGLEWAGGQTVGKRI